MARHPVYLAIVTIGRQFGDKDMTMFGNVQERWLGSVVVRASDRDREFDSRPVHFRVT